MLFGIYYYPEQTGIGPYQAAFAEHLAAQGHSIEVVTGIPHFPSWSVFHNYKLGFRSQENVRGVKVYRKWHYVPATQSVVQRTLYELTFLVTALSRKRALGRPQAVLAIVPTLSAGIAARSVARRFNVPFGLVIQDLVGAAAMQTGIKGGKMVGRVTKYIEGWIAREAREVGIISDGFRPYLEGLGVNPDRIHRLRNWARTSAPTLDKMSARAELGLPEDRFICLHAGNMGNKQGLHTIIECARLATNTPQMFFVLAGDGNQRHLLSKMAETSNLANLRIMPLQTSAAFSNLLAAADILLLTQRAAVVDMALPSKLTAYFAAGRPVVASVAETSEAAREVHQSGAGIVVAPEDPNALLNSLKTLLRAETTLAHFSAMGRAYAEDVLAPEQALKHWQKFAETVAGTPNTSDRTVT